MLRKQNFSRAKWWRKVDFASFLPVKQQKNWKMPYWQRQKSLGGGSTLLYKLYRYIMYVLPHRVGFLCRFGQKTGIHFVYR